MGCWDEAEARERAEARRKKSSPRQENEKIAVALNKPGPYNAPNRAKVVEGRSSTTIFDATVDGQGRRPSIPGGVVTRADDQLDGFDNITLSPTSPAATAIAYKRPDPTDRLNVFSEVHSARGAARQEYGKIYAAFSSFYLDGISCDDQTDAKVFRLYRDPSQQAQILAHTRRFANSDMSQGWSERLGKFDALMTTFEEAMSREFLQGLDLEDYDGKVHKYAHVLIQLNGGKRGIDLFITSNPIIVDKNKLGNPLECLNSSLSGGVALEWSQDFFVNLSNALIQQLAIVDRIFPSSAYVIIPFLHKVGEDVISDYLTRLFNGARERNPESYLIAVSGTYEQSAHLIDSLWTATRPSLDVQEIMEQVIFDAFAPHVDNYLPAEVVFFDQKSAAEVSAWEKRLLEQDASMQSMYMSNVNRQADKRDFLKSFRKVVMMPVNVLPSFPTSSPFGSKPATAKALVNGDVPNPLQLSSELTTRPDSPASVNEISSRANGSSTLLVDPPTTELAAQAAIMNSRLEGIRSLFSIEVALNLVHTAKASIERAAVFAIREGPFRNDARSKSETIFISLLQTLGTRHVRAGFDQAVEYLSRYNPRDADNHKQPGVAPLITFLELVNVGDLIQQMLDVFFEQELIATRLTDRDDFLNSAVKEKKRFEKMLDERVAAGLNKGIDALMAEVDYVLATTQTVEDYSPRASSDAFSSVSYIGPSKTAVQVIEVVSAHTKMLIGSTDKNMLDVFNQEVGLRLFTALCKHLKRQRVSVNGSITLIR